MLIDSLRLGQINVPDEKIITMAKPVLGFELLKKFALIDVEETHPFLWLQSLDDSAVSFLVVNPKLFVSDYKIEVNSKELFELKIKEVTDVETYVVVTIQNEPHEMSLNLQGPILINNANNLGKQLVLVNSNYEVRYKVDISSESEETETIELEEPALV